jgi:hypothetical protein
MVSQNLWTESLERDVDHSRRPLSQIDRLAKGLHLVVIGEGFGVEEDANEMWRKLGHPLLHHLHVLGRHADVAASLRKHVLVVLRSEALETGRGFALDQRERRHVRLLLSFRRCSHTR